MRKRRAILYDDDRHVLRLLRRFFERKGYEVMDFPEPVVCAVYNNHTHSCAKEAPCADVIVTDYKMPVMTGYELLMHQADRGCKLDIRNKAVISGFVDDSEHEKIRCLGCGFFQKPFNLSAIQNWISECEQRIDISTPLGTVDHRHEKRIPFSKKIPFHIVRDQNGEPHEGTVHNISSSGLALFLKTELPVGQLVSFDTELPNSCRSAKVAWIIKVDDKLYLSGLARED